VSVRRCVYPSFVPLALNSVAVYAVRAACGLHAVLLADREVCICVRSPNLWPHALSESPLHNEAEIKGRRREETQSRGRRLRTPRRGRMCGSETDGERW